MMFQNQKKKIVDLYEITDVKVIFYLPSVSIPTIHSNIHLFYHVIVVIAIGLPQIRTCLAYDLMNANCLLCIVFQIRRDAETVITFSAISTGGVSNFAPAAVKVYDYYNRGKGGYWSVYRAT